MCKIDILLATFNGGRYLSQQLDSIFLQEYQNFKILIRDDGSTDNTVEIISLYQKKQPEKIQFIEDDFGNIGSSESFMLLLSLSTSDYAMFCDQDDVWLPNKIIVSLNKIKSLDSKCRVPAPLLVFTDLVVVDQDLNVINKSFWRYQKLNPATAKKWKDQLVQNVITGCTVIINKRAREVCLPYSLNMMHDQWVGVMTAKHGVLDYLNEQTVLYRQHASNTDGAHNFGLQYIVFKLHNIVSVVRKLITFARYFREVSIFHLLYLKVVINFKRIMKR